DLGLPAAQERLLREVVAVGKPTILVLQSGSAVAVPWAAEHVDAVLMAWYGGEEAGTALAEVLFGDAGPAGRLPVTVYASADDLPPFESYDMEGRTYRFFRGTPLYPFGFGLSYTRFEYRDLRITPGAIEPEGEAEVSVEVANVGEVAGDEVVQLYVTDPEASVPVPLRQLQGFRRITLEPGATERVVFTLQPGQLVCYADDGAAMVEPGRFILSVGGGQPIPGGAASECVSGELEVTA
ncbi:MAG: hypothetical protein FJX74_06190, partial [Armatimonadetes bacterium]|nr:hypothetical protein [Armatimonadota bacterium]